MATPLAPRRQMRAFSILGPGCCCFVYCCYVFYFFALTVPASQSFVIGLSGPRVRRARRLPLTSSSSSTTSSAAAAAPGSSNDSDDMRARRVALDVLVAGASDVNNRGVEGALAAHPTLPLLSQRDRGFVKLLVTTTERRQGQIDKVLATFMEQFPPKCERRHGGRVVLGALRLGAAQLLFLGTPPHAAVGTAVGLLKDPALEVPGQFGRLVNAVLRAVSTGGRQALQDHTSAADNVHPLLVAEWTSAFGAVSANRICEAMLEQPHLDLSLRHPPPPPLQGGGGAAGAEAEAAAAVMEKDVAYRAEWAAALNATVLPTGSLRRAAGQGGFSEALPGFKQGEWWVQDASAALPALALVSALRKSSSAVSAAPGAPASDPGPLWCVDMCAAPGGKTAQLLAAGIGQVTAVEANKRRAKRLEENLERLGFGGGGGIFVGDGRSFNAAAATRTLLASTAVSGVTTAAAAAAAVGGKSEGAGVGGPEVEGGFGFADGVLLDVPCTATGTGRRRPDVLRKPLPPPQPQPPPPLALSGSGTVTGGGGGGGKPDKGSRRRKPLKKGKGAAARAAAEAEAEAARQAAADFNTLLAVQASLGDHCARHVLKPGGILVYASCSLLPAEGEAQAHALLRLTHDEYDGGDHGDDAEADGVEEEEGDGGEQGRRRPLGRPLLEPLPLVAGELPGFDGALTPEGFLRVLPGTLPPPLDSVDGFFLARFRKTAQ